MKLHPHQQQVVNYLKEMISKDQANELVILDWPIKTTYYTHSGGRGEGSGATNQYKNNFLHDTMNHMRGRGMKDINDLPKGRGYKAPGGRA